MGAAGLACGGGPAPRPPTEPAPVAAPEPTPAPTGPALRLWWLEPAAGACAWAGQTVPGGAREVLAKLPVKCPEAPRFAVGAGAAAVHTDSAVWLWSGGLTAEQLPAPPGKVQAVGFDGKVPLVCADVAEAEPVGAAEGGKYRYLDAGRDYTVAAPGSVAALFVRSWRYEGGSWKVAEQAVVPQHEGETGPWCTAMPGFPGSPRRALLDLEAEMEQGWEPAAGPEASALVRLAKPTEGEWHVRADGKLAAVAFWFEGRHPTTPVAWKPDGKPWALVPELEKGGTWKVVGDLLLTGAGGRSVLRDVAAGTELWSGPQSIDATGLPAPR